MFIIIISRQSQKNLTEKIYNTINFSRLVITFGVSLIRIKILKLGFAVALATSVCVCKIYHYQKFSMKTIRTVYTYKVRIHY